jgi:hypothetical protein
VLGGGAEVRSRIRLLFSLDAHPTVFQADFLQCECRSRKKCTRWVCTGEQIIYAQISKHLYNHLRH